MNQSASFLKIYLLLLNILSLRNIASAFRMSPFLLTSPLNHEIQGHRPEAYEKP